MLLTPSSRLSLSESANRVSQLPTPGPSGNRPKRTMSIKLSRVCAESLVLFHSTPRSPKSRELNRSDTQSDRVQQVLRVPQVPSTCSLADDSTPVVSATSPFRKRHCTIRGFLRHAVVWIARTGTSSRPSWRAPTRDVVPHGHQVQSLNSLMIACGWCEAGQVCDWTQYGVIFVDDSDHEFSWMDSSLKPLMTWRATLAHTNRTSEKPIVLLGMSLLKHDTLDAELNILDHVLCRFG